MEVKHANLRQCFEELHLYSVFEACALVKGQWKRLTIFLLAGKCVVVRHHLLLLVPEDE